MRHLDLLAPDGSTLFAFNDPQGESNSWGVVVRFATHNAFNLSSPSPETEVVAYEHGGGAVLRRVDPLVMMDWECRLEGLSFADLMGAAGYVGDLLASRGRLRWYDDEEISAARLIHFEASPMPAVLTGQQNELWFATTEEGRGPFVNVHFAVLRQPYLYGEDELDPALNKLVNSDLFDYDGSGTAPEGWAFDSTSDITAQAFDEAASAFGFTIAVNAARNLRQVVMPAAPGQSWTGSFSGRYEPDGDQDGARCAVVLEFLDGANNVLQTDAGDLTVLTELWQRFVETGIAPASTEKVRISLRIHPTGAGANDVQLRGAQLEPAASASEYRTSVQTVAFDPTTSPRRIVACWGPGDAPCLPKVTVTADPAGLQEYRLARIARPAAAVAQQVAFIDLEDATLETGTASAADSEAVSGDVAEVTYSATAPSSPTGAVASGALSDITLDRPTGAEEGNLLQVAIWRSRSAEFHAAPDGWHLLKSHQGGGSLAGGHSERLSLWWIILGPIDEEPTSYTWRVVNDPVVARSSVAFIRRIPGVDPDDPIMDFRVKETDNNTAIPTDALTTDTANAYILAGAFGRSAGSAVTWTPPAGSTPTFTELIDQQADVTSVAGTLADGTLAAAGALAAKTFTASVAVDGVTFVIAYRTAPAPLELRATTDPLVVEPGSYDVFLRSRLTAASKQRVRLRWAHSSVGEFESFPDLIVNMLDASDFDDFFEIPMGRVYVPGDVDTGGIVFELHTGLEEASSAKFRGDTLYLTPADGFIGSVSSDVVLGEDEDLFTDPDPITGPSAYHRDGADALLGRAFVSGPTPTELEPGRLNLFVLQSWTDVPDGGAFRRTVLDATQQVAFAPTPRWRT